MSVNLLKVSPSNLPTYVYDLVADVAFVHDDGVYKLKHYKFDSIRVVVNQPLRKGDSLCSNAYYPGNSNIEVIQHLMKKGVLGGLEKELRYYCGCIIGDLLIEHSPGKHNFETCGIGNCTLFIELSACKTGDKWRELDNFGTIDEISKEQHDAWQKALDEYNASGDIEWWKLRIADWDERLELIGNKSDFLLIY